LHLAHYFGANVLYYFCGCVKEAEQQHCIAHAQLKNKNMTKSQVKLTLNAEFGIHLV
jgi:Zn-dependent M16 (insulinase) family peptidase